MYIRHLNLLIAAGLLCLLSTSCKPDIPKQEASTKTPAASAARPKLVVKETTTPDADNVAQHPLFPAGTLMEHRGSIEITHGAPGQAAEKKPVADALQLRPGDHISVAAQSSATLNIRRIGQVKLSGGSQVRFPEHAPCGLEHWEGSLVVHGPPVFEPAYNKCWIHTPTAAVFSGKGEAEIHVAPGGQSIVHNLKGALFLADHDGVIRKLQPGESVTVEWTRTSAPQQPMPNAEVSAFMKAHLLEPQTVTQIGQVGQNWTKRFGQVFDIALDLARKHRAASVSRKELANLEPAVAAAKAQEMQRKIGPLVPKRHEAEQKLTIIYHRMNQIKRLTAATNPNQFAEFDKIAATVQAKIPRLFQFGPSRTTLRLKAPKKL